MDGRIQLIYITYVIVKLLEVESWSTFAMFISVF